MNPISSEDEFTWASLAVLVGMMLIAAAVWAWWSSEFFYGYLMLVAGVYGLLRAARHYRTAWRIEREDEEWRERRYREWQRSLEEGRGQ